MTLYSPTSGCIYALGRPFVVEFRISYSLNIMFFKVFGKTIAGGAISDAGQGLGNRHGGCGRGKTVL
jgi:hypothetical protein